MTSIIPLVEVDPALVEELLDAAFGKDRKARTAYKVREGATMLEGLSLAVVDTDQSELIGSIQCWPTAVTDSDSTKHPMIMVGPVAVHPDCQGDGFGQLLMNALLKELQHDESLPMVMIGDPEYYGRFFGFSAQRTKGWKLPGPWDPERLLLRARDDVFLPDNGTLGPWGH